MTGSGSHSWENLELTRKCRRCNTEVTYQQYMGYMHRTFKIPRCRPVEPAKPVQIPGFVVKCQGVPEHCAEIIKPGFHCISCGVVCSYLEISKVREASK